MIITYYFGRNEVEFDYEADYEEVLDIIYTALKADGYNTDGITDDLIEEYFDICYDDIKDHFCADAYEQWKDQESYRSDRLGYYGFSNKDFI